VAYKEVHSLCEISELSGPLGIWCSAQRQCRKQGALTPERIAQLDALGFCWGSPVVPWDKTYAELVAYKEAHGHCNVPKGSGSLGSWCSAQRQRRKQGALTPERIAQLDAIDFCWDPYNELWDKRVAELVAYKEVNGDCTVSTENGILGRWCIAVRANRNRGELSSERIAQLDALGVCWDLRDAHWDKKITELLAYKEVNGDCNVPSTTGPLGSWCGTVRQSRRQGKISPERIAQLDAMGFCWDILADFWNEKIIELVAYKEVNGDCNVPTENGALGTWCAHLRRFYSKGKLTPKRIAHLEAIGFCWDPIETARDKRVAELVAYKKAHGDCNVPAASGPLGAWCNSTRRRRIKGMLSAERIAQLDAIGFCWDVPAADWNKRLAEIVAYKEAKGNCNVPPSNGSLGRWCTNIRNYRKSGKVSPERIAQLDAIGFCWKLRATVWDKRLAEIVAYKEAHGDCNMH
jgi:hypothetical protein